MVENYMLAFQIIATIILVIVLIVHIKKKFLDNSAIWLLIFIAVVWILPLSKSIELPGGAKVDLSAIKTQLARGKEERIELGKMVNLLINEDRATDPKDKKKIMNDLIYLWNDSQIQKSLMMQLPNEFNK